MVSLISMVLILFCFRQTFSFQQVPRHILSHRSLLQPSRNSLSFQITKSHQSLHGSQIFSHSENIPKRNASKGKISWLSPHGQDDEVVREILAGVVTALATIPTSVAYASLVGMNPLSGIWSSAILGFTIAKIGGGPGLIAGAAGVVAIPLSKLVAVHGLQYVAPTILLASIIEFLFGILKLSKIADIVTEPVIAGFLNAFALFLLKSQVNLLVRYIIYYFSMSHLLSMKLCLNMQWNSDKSIHYFTLSRCSHWDCSILRQCYSNYSQNY